MGGKDPLQHFRIVRAFISWTYDSRLVQAFGCLINSVIHCMMYSHYLYTSFGLENPFKKLITQAQLIQFATCIVRES